MTQLQPTQHRNRWTGPAAVLGAVSALARSLALADPAPALVSAAARGAVGWWLAAGPLLALAVAWRLAGQRERGLAQQRWVAGEPHLLLARCIAAHTAVELARATPGAVAGSIVAAGAARLRAGGTEASGLHVLFGRGAPSWAFVAAGLLSPILGMLFGCVFGLAATTRRQLAAGSLVAGCVTVSVIALRPWVPQADTLAPYTPLGGVWPVTLGWSLNRWFALAAPPGHRLAGIALWSTVAAVAARRRHRAGAARRQPTARR